MYTVFISTPEDTAIAYETAANRATALVVVERVAAVAEVLPSSRVLTVWYVRDDNPARDFHLVETDYGRARTAHPAGRAR